MGTRYWLLLSAYLISSMGTWIYRLALPLLVLDLTGSALGTGAVYALEYLPFLVLGLLGGVIADRFGRKPVLVIGDLAAGVLALLLAVVVTMGPPPLWVIYLLVLLLSCVDPLYRPAFNAIVPSLVTPDRLPPANARVHIGEHGTNMIGPALGGAMIVAFGYETAIYVDAATFFVSAALLAPIGRLPAVRRRDVSVRAGLRYLFVERREVLATALVSFACNVGVWLLLANLVFYLSAYHAFTPTQIGVVYAFQGAGAVVGGLAGSRLLRRGLPPWVLIAAGAALGGLSMLAMIPARGPVLIGLAWTGQFAGAGILIVATMTLRQQVIPDELLGRVLGTARMIAFAAIPVAALLAGAFETLVGNAYLLMAVAGTSWLVIALAVTRSPIRPVSLEKVP
ncbi:MFS transporter [Nonomuraea soli]|uniref:MFS family permease n=1 Tax=Nonomuraea soli TaxID=1032476 RepID=A0A7W0HSF5_9ACTN|nr:MFS transporter [Nonomuraea soli]MBA2893979.1 MFS family permease [Nonomuraea soli]